MQVEGEDTKRLGGMMRGSDGPRKQLFTVYRGLYYPMIC